MNYGLIARQDWAKVSPSMTSSSFLPLSSRQMPHAPKPASPGDRIGIPLLSAPMDTVTEALAIAWPKRAESASSTRIWTSNHKQRPFERSNAARTGDFRSSHVASRKTGWSIRTLMATHLSRASHHRGRHLPRTLGRHF